MAINYYDPDTIISDLEYYTPEYYDTGLVQKPTDEEKPKQQQDVPSYDDLLKFYNTYRESGDQKNNTDNVEPMARNASNNFGYFNKPALMDFAGALPGAAGVVGQMANVGVNLSNKGAIDKAREYLGLGDSSLGSNVVKDNKGYVADVNIADKNYSVGLEALDNRGRTTLTPDEARTRSMLNGGIREATKAEKKESLKDYTNKHGDIVKDVLAGGVKGGLTGGPMGAVMGATTGAVKGVAGSLIDNVFDIRDKDKTPEQKAIDVNTSERAPGLAGISKSFSDQISGGINYSHPDRGPVTKGLTDRSIEVMNSLAGSQPGGINVTSAYRSPSVNASIGGAKSSLHMSGDAFDMSTKGLTAEQKRDLVERSIMAGGVEIGTYPDQSLHIGTTQRVSPLDSALTGGVTAMYDRSKFNYDNAPDWYKSGIEESHLAPVPEARPDPSTIEGFASSGWSSPSTSAQSVDRSIDVSAYDNTSGFASPESVDQESTSTKDDDKESSTNSSETSGNSGGEGSSGESHSGFSSDSSSNTSSNDSGGFSDPDKSGPQ